MLFIDLQTLLLESLRTRVRNGELTERGLAKLVGVSQPHIHNVLKGTRLLSMNLADQILTHLNLSVFDLVEPGQLEPSAAPAAPETIDRTFVPVLEGRLGPGHPWPTRVHGQERFEVPAKQLSGMIGAVVVELAEDVAMSNVFDAGDFALLDQSLAARTTVEENGLYAVKRGNTGLLRRLRTEAGITYIVAEDALADSAAWEPINLEYQTIQYVVRARATLVVREIDWIR
jgi:hypothetical protein